MSATQQLDNSESSMRISYRMSADDLVQIVCWWPTWRRWAWRLGGILHLPLYFIPPTALLLIFQMWTGIIAGAVLYVGLGILLVRQSWKFKKAWRETVQKLSSEDSVISICPDQLELSGPVGKSRHAWSEIQRTAFTETNAFLFFGREEAISVPLGACGTDEEANRFVRLVQQYTSRSPERPMTAFDGSARFLSDAEVRAAVTYRITPADYREFIYYGVGKPKERRRGPMGWMFSYAAIGAIVAYLTRNSDWQWQMLGGTFAYAGLGLPSVALFNIVMQFREVNRMPERRWQQRTITVCESGIHALAATSESLIGWRHVDSLRADDRFISISQTSSQHTYLIPQRAFEPEQSARFIALFNAFSEADGGARIEERLPEVDPNNPYHPPSTA